MTQLKTPRYHIDQFANGFRISGVDRCPVEVTLERTHLRMVSGNQTERIGLYDYRKMNQWIAGAVMRGWKSSRAVTEPSYRPRWMQRSTARALNSRIHPLWQELVNQADPAIRDVHRKVFAATFSSSHPILFEEELYRHPYLVADIERFPAAAIATAAVKWMSLHVPWILERYPYAAQRRRDFDTARLDLEFADKPPTTVTAEDITFRMDLLENWRALFSPNGVTYTSLDKTLMNLPGRTTPGILVNLHKVTLERPVYDRLELMTIGAAAECRRRHHDRVFAHAQRNDILRAMDLVNEDCQMGNTMTAKSRWPKTRDITFFTRYLSDFPDLHDGRIVGLAQKAVRWHREERRTGHQKQLEALGLNTLTSRPPLPIPAIQGIQFLATVDEIREEADRMEHCVASYARDAVRGDCYLFHIEHNGECATVEIDQAGRVHQARGPRNRFNNAASWGQKVLGDWGSQFPLPEAQSTKIVVPIATCDLPF